MSTLFIKLWDDFNLHRCVAHEGFEKSVVLGRKSLCTTTLNIVAIIYGDGRKIPTTAPIPQ